ncbi:aspartate ammonia-lyase [Tsukamurella spumae]|uniref:Aspartate ammonia-lyase n=1 Tax=Tsukamurella spumae TaxID=44753 RepID=A0A846X1K6_9ACTN|nr:aspartate ammonia-lyase [Tsukamurella spumae]NKY19063.1 aspartate ammonia-lyase [Tsukamurella spumae]
MTSPQTRSEHDLLGDIDVPADAYYGAHTARALLNFPITGIPIATHTHLVNALAAVKQAAATANRDLGLLDEEKAGAIVAACERIRGGELHEWFLVDTIAGGAGTSTNMNANEVIANAALEHLGRPRGEYTTLSPLDHVNLGQSTNDVYPTAVKIALITQLRELQESLTELRGAFGTKSGEFAGIVKMGRTQLQDAVPMTLGQEFGAFATTLGEDIVRLQEATRLLHELNIGGTAIGTALNSHPGYRSRVIERLREITGVYELVGATDLIEATADVGVFVQLSGVLKRIAVKLSKTCNDLRLLSSGPRAGLGEIHLPAVQAGSSIMPGKVNPVIPEVVNQIAYEVIGHDVTITMAAEGGQLQLNAFEPIIARSLVESISHLTRGARVLGERCVVGITANRDRLERMVGESIGVVTALSPAIGYAAATSVAAEALESGRGVVEIVRERGLLDDATLDSLLTPEYLTGHPPLALSPQSDGA